MIFGKFNGAALGAALAALTIWAPRPADAKSAEAFRSEAQALKQIVEPAPRDQKAAALASDIQSSLDAGAGPKDPKERASLQISLAMALHEMTVEERSWARARLAASSAARALDRTQDATEWALANKILASILADPPSLDEAQAAIVKREGRAAANAALSYYTRDAHPLDYVEIQCGQIWNGDQIPQDYDYSRGLPQRISAMVGVCAGQGWLSSDGLSSILNQNRMGLPLLLATSEDSTDQDNRLILENMASGADRARYINGILSLEDIGLSDEQVLTARRLRARADRLAPGLTDDTTQTGADGWRARAELVDLFMAAKEPPQRPSAVTVPVVAIFVIDRERGAAVAEAPGGAIASALTSGDWPERTMAQMQQSMMEMVSHGDFDPSTGPAILRGFAEGRPIDQWMSDYQAGDFVSAIDNFRNDYESKWSPLIASAAQKANAKKGERLIIIPDGAASMLPLGILRNPATGRSLVEDYEVVFAPSLSIYERAQQRAQKATGKSMVLVVPSQERSGLPALTGTQTEAALVGAGFEAHRAPDGPAADVLSRLRGATYWHFAAHGVFDPAAPLDSWVQVGGKSRLEKMTLNDLFGAENAVGAPRLVVLSACETGLFDTSRNPDEFIGLPAGFLALGAAGVVGALWQVSDASTTLLMAKFYELIGAGERPSAALRHAQLWLKDASKATLVAYVNAAAARSSITSTQASELTATIGAEQADVPYAHPYYWGGFVFYGA